MVRIVPSTLPSVHDGPVLVEDSRISDRWLRSVGRKVVKKSKRRRGREGADGEGKER